MEIKQEIGLNFEATPRAGGAEVEARQDIANLFSDKIGQIATKPDTYKVPASEQPTHSETLSPIAEIQRIGANLEALRTHAKVV